MEQAVKKPFYKKWWVITLAVIFVPIALGALLGDPEYQAPTVAQSDENLPVVQEKKDVIQVEKKVVQPVVEKTPTTQVATPPPVPTQTPQPTPPQSDRASILVILKADASEKWGDNYQMVKYEYDNQVEAYDWVVAQAKYPEIMVKAKQKWGHNYQMVKYEYENQVEAYQSL